MANTNFVHLRVHTAYSLSEGAIPIGELLELCRAREMPAVAITDTNNMFGALEFSTAAAKAVVQPIIGCQLNLTCDRPRRGNGVQEVAQGSSEQASESDPLVLLVQDETGYHNLMKLMHQAYLDEAADPQVPMAVLE